MGLSFLNGGFLWGLSLAGIPIIIHLLQRRRFTVVRWGAMEFLQLSQKNRSRRLMLEQLLLLLIRCLIVGLIVLAVCRPVARLGGLGIVGARGPVHAVILLDTSYSMGYRTGGKAETAFARALARTEEIIEQGLRQGDAVSVILCTDPPRALIRRPSLDLRAAAALVKRRATLSDSATSYGKAARLAMEILGESRFINREVFLIGDNQASGWQEAGAASAWEALGKLARIAVVPTREGAAANAAVEWVQAARGLATARASSRIQARIVNYGPRPLRGQMVTLDVDGRPEGTAQRLDIEPGQGALASFNHSFDRPGVHRCTVKLSGDRLAVDDTGFLALRVRQSVRVLVLNGKPDAIVPQKDAAFFLQTALSPPPAGPGAEPAAIQPDVLVGTRFGNAGVRDYDALILAEVPSLEEGDRRLLSEFVQNGGGVLIFPGGRTDPAIYNRDFFDASPRLLPARMGSVKSAATTLDPASIDHPALRRFRAAQDVELTTASFTRHFDLNVDTQDRTVRVLLRFADGRPALVERQFGLGRVLLAASTGNTEWNDLPLKPAFLPLLHQLTAYLASGGEGTRNGQVGETITRPLPLAEAGKSVTLVNPQGDRSSVRSSVHERGAIVTIEAPEYAGYYRLEASGQERDVFAVNRDTRESDLAALDETALKRLVPNTAWSWIGPNEDLLAILNRSRQGIELWRSLLTAALLLMALETVLAQVFGRRA